MCTDLKISVLPEEVGAAATQKGAFPPSNYNENENENVEE